MAVSWARSPSTWARMGPGSGGGAGLGGGVPGLATVVGGPPTGTLGTPFLLLLVVVVVWPGRVVVPDLGAVVVGAGAVVVGASVSTGVVVLLPVVWAPAPVAVPTAVALKVAIASRTVAAAGRARLRTGGTWTIS